MNPSSSNLPRIAMLHTGNDGTGAYRTWIPSKWLERKEYATIVRLPDELPPMTPPSWETFLRGSDLVVSQRVDRAETLALLLAVRDTFRMPLIGDVDDDFRNVSLFNPAYGDFQDPRFEEMYQEVRPEDVLTFKSHGLHVLSHRGRWWVYRSKTDARGWSLKFLQSCDAITVSTPELATAMDDVNKRIFVLPNGIDFEEIESPVKEAHAKFRFGWFGGKQHYGDLLLIKDAVMEFLDRHPDEVEFHLMGVMPDFWVSYAEAHPDRMTVLPFLPMQEWPKKFTALNWDLSLAPLVDHPFNWSKSELKWMEASARGIPSICSPQPPYKRAGHTLFATDTKSWVDAMETLFTDTSWRHRLAQDAYQACRERYDIGTLVEARMDAYQITMERWAKEPFESRMPPVMGRSAIPGGRR